MKGYREIWLEDIRYPFSRFDLYTETTGMKKKFCLTDNRCYIYERGFDSHHLSHQCDGLFTQYFSISSVSVGPSVLISFYTEYEIFQFRPVLIQDKSTSDVHSSCFKTVVYHLVHNTQTLPKFGLIDR